MEEGMNTLAYTLAGLLLLAAIVWVSLPRNQRRWLP